MAKEYEHKNNYVEPELQILNNSSKTGYDVTHSKKSRADKSSSWNGCLVSNKGDQIKLWISDISIDFSLTGSTGQSRYRRQFFPRSFNQSTITIVGQMPNQTEYNRLAAFVRETHSLALTNNESMYQSKAGQVKNQVKASDTTFQTIGLLIKSRSSKKTPKKNLKGAHKDLQFEGYIKSIDAGASRFNFAPEFKIEFTVAGSKWTTEIGIYDETFDTGSKLLSITEWMNKYGFGQQKFASTTGNNSRPAPTAPETLGPTQSDRVLVSAGEGSGAQVRDYLTTGALGNDPVNPITDKIFHVM